MLHSAIGKPRSNQYPYRSSLQQHSLPLRGKMATAAIHNEAQLPESYQLGFSLVLFKGILFFKLRTENKLTRSCRHVLFSYAIFKILILRF
jgi:hypothetical protein